MGRMVMVKCNCGFVKDDYKYGFTAAYSELQKHLTALVKSGQYGNMWRDLLASDRTLLVDAAWAVYQCPRCHQIYDECSLDLYKADRNFFAPDPEEVIYHYKHICPECQKKMERILLYQNRNCIYEKPEELVICPKCGDIAIVSFCGFID
ncbi:MAG: hypothetical protein ACI4XB_06555 [Ruminococcus sp.]